MLSDGFFSIDISQTVQWEIGVNEIRRIQGCQETLIRGHLTSMVEGNSKTSVVGTSYTHITGFKQEVDLVGVLNIIVGLNVNILVGGQVNLLGGGKLDVIGGVTGLIHRGWEFKSSAMGGGEKRAAVLTKSTNELLETIHEEIRKAGSQFEKIDTCNQKIASLNARIDKVLQVVQTMMTEVSGEFKLIAGTMNYVSKGVVNMKASAFDIDAPVKIKGNLWVKGSVFEVS